MEGVSLPLVVGQGLVLLTVKNIDTNALSSCPSEAASSPSPNRSRCTEGGWAAQLHFTTKEICAYLVHTLILPIPKSSCLKPAHTPVESRGPNRGVVVVMMENLKQ